MQYLDFLSDSPKIFIFKKDSNKTNFGGILFLIYIAIMILISLAYILEYALNEKYSIENFSVFNFSRGNEEIRLNDDIELNPYLDINITFSEGFLYGFLAIHTNFFNGVTKEILEEKFFMQGEYPIYYYNFKERVNFTDFTISFKCWDDSNCTLFSGFLYAFGDRPIGFFYFYNP